MLGIDGDQGVITANGGRSQIRNPVVQGELEPPPSPPSPPLCPVHVFGCFDEDTHGLGILIDGRRRYVVVTGSELWLRNRDTSSIDWPSRTGTRRDQPRRSSERGGKFGFDVVQILEPPTVVDGIARSADGECKRFALQTGLQVAVLTSEKQTKLAHLDAEALAGS